MTAKAAVAVWLYVIAFLPVFRAEAHGDLHERITAVSATIASAPPDAKLYLKRAELYREHEDWDAALADCAKASELDPSLDGAILLRGQTLLEAGRPGDALTVFDRFLRETPEDAAALLSRARCLEKLGRHPDAAAAFTLAISLAATPEPEHYLERARAVKAGGGDALPGLDEGIEKLGPIVTLEAAAIELELAKKNYCGALRRVELLANRSERKEAWLARKAEILSKAGRTGEARAARAEALRAIDSLPQRLRKTAAMEELAVHLRSELERTNVSP